MEDSHFHCADPDFRKNPKTDRFCWHCQRDLKIGVGYKIFVSKEFILNLIHKEYKDLYEHYECLIGPECAKHIPSDFVVYKEKQGETMKYYAYNKTFKHYASPKESFDKESVEAFIERNNKCKGGVWELHTEEQHSSNSRNEQHREFLRQER